MDFYQHNAAWLSRKDSRLMTRIEGIDDDPSFEVTPSRRGDPTLRVGQVQVHSAYDPVREADSIASRSLDRLPASATVVVCGLGLGYIALAVLSRFPGRGVIMEPDPGIL